ncbi:MAG: hypothetical protein U0166_24425 [Acidobacteriota bacterium]
MRKSNAEARESKSGVARVLPATEESAKSKAAALVKDLKRDAAKDPKDYVTRWVVPGGGE